MTPKRFWARLRAPLELPLRRGAWYRVRRLGLHEVVLDVAGDAVYVLRAALEVVSTPPKRWTVVPRPEDTTRFPNVSHYAVCPKCAQRAPLGARLAVLHCPRCNQAYDVAWDEAYLVSGRPPPGPPEPPRNAP